MSIVFRPYAGEDDYEAIRDIIVRKFEEPNRRFYPSLGDLDYNRSFGGEEFFKKLVIIAIEDNTIIGAIWPGYYRILYCVTCPRYAHESVCLGREMQACLAMFQEKRC